MFHIVEFADKKVAVVPAVWVSNGICSWPPYKNGNEMSKAVKKQEIPNPDWAKYAVIVRCTKNSYDAIRPKLALAEQQSDLQTESEDDTMPSYKRRKGRGFNRKYIQSDNEDDVGDNGDFEETISDVNYLPDTANATRQPTNATSPPNVPERTLGITPPPLFPPPQLRTTLMVNTPATRQMQSEADASTSQATDAGTVPPNVPERTLGITAQTPQLPTSLRLNTPARRQLQIETTTPVQIEILTQLEIIKQQQAQILLLLQKQNSMGAMGTDQTEVVAIAAKFPIKDRSGLTTLEQELRESPAIKEKAINYFGIIGGTNVRDTTWRTLQKMISNDLARSMNWKGANGKVSFSDSCLREIVNQSVRKIFVCAEATDVAIESVVKRWLHLAPDRDGGRKERARRQEELQ
ncbi:uncharacterized protein LOC134321766 isoform X3 [Trichomycterus rosablanca]|uniref:uncharacterized protein LOC134314339 isoform X3 n=2 Tax=Trichomycterus rosablanca TaxID=2290929 RepID=UPI002F3582F5